MIRTLVIACVVSLGLAVAVPAGAADAGARKGAAWLRTHAPRSGDGASADAVVALAAGGQLSRADARARAAALRNGAASYARTAGANAKLILGLRAARVGNPRCAGSRDLLRQMNRFRKNGRYGTTVFDQTLAMMAARALAAGPQKASTTVLLRARGSGGWNFRMTRASGSDSVSSTALALIALRGAGISRNNASLRSALNWMTGQRRASGGYSEDGGGRSQANPTALALRAVRAMGYSDPKAERALRSLQSSDGSFLFTRTDAGSRLLATNDAVLALSGRTQPVGALHRTPGACG